LGSATITHPYHPLRGQSFVVLKARRVGGVQTLILRGAADDSFAVPLAWTDRAEPSPWTALKKFPPFLHAPHLSALVELLDLLSPPEDREGLP
jgi:hypothetical protein